MHALRSFAQQARLVLAWFCLTLGVAVASPVLHPQSFELVCTNNLSMKLVVLDADGDAVDVATHTTLECPACLSITLPTALVQPRFEPIPPLAHAVRPLAAAHITARIGAPLPPRGPPGRRA